MPHGRTVLEIPDLRWSEIAIQRLDLVLHGMALGVEGCIKRVNSQCQYQNHDGYIRRTLEVEDLPTHI